MLCPRSSFKSPNESRPACLLGLLGYDLVFDLVVCRLRDNFLSHKFIFPLSGRIVRNFFTVITDSGKRLQFGSVMLCFSQQFFAKKQAVRKVVPLKDGDLGNLDTDGGLYGDRVFGFRMDLEISPDMQVVDFHGGRSRTRTYDLSHVRRAL